MPGLRKRRIARACGTPGTAVATKSENSLGARWERLPGAERKRAAVLGRTNLNKHAAQVPLVRCGRGNRSHRVTHVRPASACFDHRTGAQAVVADVSGPPGRGPGVVTDIVAYGVRTASGGTFACVDAKWNTVRTALGLGSGSSWSTTFAYAKFVVVLRSSLVFASNVSRVWTSLRAGPDL